jgi:biotin synthase
MPSSFSIAGFEEVPQIPVSILSSLASLDYGDLVRMCDPGEDIFTAALDAVTPEIFDRARSGVGTPYLWDQHWCALDWAVDFYGP